MQRALAPLGEVVAVDMENCELSNPDAIHTLVRSVKSNIIGNPAAYTAQADQAAAYAVNGAAPGVLGKEAAKMDALVVHYSTDYVFDGTKAEPCAEGIHTIRKASTAKANVKVKKCYKPAVSTIWSFVPVEALVRKAVTLPRLQLCWPVIGNALTVAADQWGAPTSAPLIADTTSKVIAQYKVC